MSETPSAGAQPRLRAARIVLAWVRGAARSPRQLTLVGVAAVLLVVAWVAPSSRANVIDSVPVSLAFFATLLTGEAVIFALSFSASSAWPSLREIDRHIAFREWVVTGWVAAMLAAAGLLTGTAIPIAYGALLFLLADVFGMFSFVRLFGLASAGGRQRLLCRTLGGALAREPAAAGGLRERVAGDRVLRAYLGELDRAVAGSEGGVVRDLAAELVAAAEAGVRTGDGRAVGALHLEVVHRLARAALVGALDPVVASSAADTLMESLLRQIRDGAGDGVRSPRVAQDAAAVLGQASRYLAWLGSTALILSVREVTAAGAARELAAFSVRARQRVLLLADPDPPYAAGPDDLGTPLGSPEQVLAWIAPFCEFQGAYQAAGMYPVYEILTGSKFLGNYWDGDSVLAALREALFGAGASGLGAAADTTVQAFGTAAEFDRVWTLISAGALATLRDVRLAHPPELIRPEFTPDPQLLGAYVRTFASHRYFTTAAEAMTALASVVGCAGPPGCLWERVQEIGNAADWVAPMPVMQPHRRLAACVLAVASRLAPLAAGDPDVQLRSFLAGLPEPVLAAAARLAARTLPGAASVAAVSPVEAVAGGLRVVQLVGTHRVSAR